MDAFSTTELIAIREETAQDTQFLLNAFFLEEHLSETESISFDLISKSRKLAPFVSPCVEGRVRRRDGFKTQSVKPAYVKPKSVLKPCGSKKRKVGEQINGELSPQQRLDDQVTDELMEHEAEIQRREEWMAANALWQGKYTLSGEDYPEQEIDFGRDASMNVGPLVWDAAAHPFEDLEAMSSLVLDKVGAAGNVVVMGKTAWNILHKHDETRDLHNLRNGVNSGLNLTPEVAALNLFKGVIGGFEFWVYDGSYEDDSGTTQKFIPDNAVMVINIAALQGLRCYGLIEDFENLEPAVRFPKQWMQKDPSGMCLLTQSAPLIVPVGVNAVATATVSES